MSGDAVRSSQVIFLLLLTFVVVFGWLARRLRIPYPIIMVIGGLLLALIPRLPAVPLNPELFFLGILPPLLYSAAWETSWREFRFNLVSIAMLALGLVGFTVVGVAFAAPHILPGFNWTTGLLLGAVLSTTDAIAATSIARRVGLPQRIVDILEGESLVNDATGLLALEFGLALVVGHEAPSAGSSLLRLFWLIVGGIAAGLLCGKITVWIEHQIDDGPIEIVISVLVPYAAYLAAEGVHASGVLAVVACGLLVSHHSADFFSPQVRLQAWAFWEALIFVLNSLVFVVIGLQLPFVRQGLAGFSLPGLLWHGIALSAVLIVLRVIWMFPGAHVAHFLRTRLLRQQVQLPPGRQIFVVGWTGMRGVVALAAALSLPAVLPNGEVFAQRPMIVFLTFSTILVTLVLQGLTLPALIRALGLAGAAEASCEEGEARRIVLEAALAHIQHAREGDDERFAAVYESAAQYYRQQLSAVAEDESSTRETPEELERSQRLWGDLLRVRRRTAIDLRNQGRINDGLLRKLERELDLSESSLAQRQG